MHSLYGYNRNYWALALEGACFMGGIAVIATSGTVALFINAMTGSKTLIGFAVTIQALFILVGQLSSAPYARSINNLPEFLFKAMAIQRIIPLLMALPLFLRVAGNGSVGIFLVLFAVFWFIDGLMSTPWGELCARALEPEFRGHMMGMQVTLGGIASLLTGLPLTWLLATPMLSDHHRFAWVFVLASAVLLLSLIFIRLVRDPNPVKNPERLHIGQYYARILPVIRHNKHLRYAMLARIPAFIGFSSVSFMMVFGVSALSLSETQVSWLVYANMIGGLVGGILLGEASRRFGNKTNILLCNIGVFIALSMAVSLAFFPVLGYIWLFVTCVLASLTINNWFGYLNYFLDIAPSEERSIFQVVGTCIGIPFSFSGYAMGAVIDNYGYITMFIIGGFFVVAAILLNTRLLSKRQLQELLFCNHTTKA